MNRCREMTIVGLSVILVFVLVGWSFQVWGAARSALVSREVEDEIEGLVMEGNIPSLHLCIVSGGSINWVKGFGEEMDLDTPFLIGSIQKVFVAISVMQLYERGRIELDTDVSQYLPFGLVSPRYPNVSITVRMLLSHRSGLGDLPYEFCYDWDGLPYPEYRTEYSPSVIGISLGQYLQMCLAPDGEFYSYSNWLAWKPGTEYSYANAGYKLLACLVETVANQTISEYMQQNIFAPLRLNNTGFDAAALTTPQATPYTRIGSINIALPVWNGQYMMRSSIKDMGHLLVALMNMGEFDGHQLLQAQTVEMMMENTYSNLTTRDLPRELRWKGYGLGLDIFSQGLCGHGGSTIGFTADCHFTPTLRRGYVRLSNVNSILNPGVEEWGDILHYTDQIRFLVLTHVGMVPRISLAGALLPYLSIALFLTFIARIVLGRRRRKPVEHPGDPNR